MFGPYIGGYQRRQGLHRRPPNVIEAVLEFGGHRLAGGGSLGTSGANACTADWRTSLALLEFGGDGLAGWSLLTSGANACTADWRTYRWHLRVWR